MFHGAGIPSARRRGAKVGLVYTGLTLYLLLLWWGYPIVWGLAEGSNTITVDAEVCYLADVCITLHNFDCQFAYCCPVLKTIKGKPTIDFMVVGNYAHCSMGPSMQL